MNSITWFSDVISWNSIPCIDGVVIVGEQKKNENVDTDRINYPFSLIFKKRGSHLFFINQVNHTFVVFSFHFLGQIPFVIFAKLKWSCDHMHFLAINFGKFAIIR